MSNPTQPARQAPQIAIASYRAVVQGLDPWRLRILWRIGNMAGQTLYLLLAQPLITTIADPLVLDHSAHEPTVPLSANAAPRFRIAAIGPRDTLEHWMDYSLALPAATQSLRIVGRFGYSLMPPDSGWELSQNWRQIEHWQQIAESSPVDVIPQP